MIGGGGGVVWMRWWQWCSLMFDNVRAGGPKIQNQAIVAWFWAACGLLDVDDVDVENGAVVLYPPPLS